MANYQFVTSWQLKIKQFQAHSDKIIDLRSILNILVLSFSACDLMSKALP